MKNINEKIGFIQGRLSNLVDGKIQAFPWDDWKKEFQIASDLNIKLMEWTLDQERLYESPLMTDEGQTEIRDLMQKYSIKIDSLTGDCFMQAPYWKAEGDARDALIEDFKNIIKSCSNLSIKYIVVPLVDNGSVENETHKKSLFAGLNTLSDQLRREDVKIVFESDYDANKLAEFIAELDDTLFAINYDVGNSAALGYKPDEEIRAYGNRIWNVHIKDRILNGTTVALGQGDADFDTVFKELQKYNYDGNFILQTARADNNNHAEVLKRYKNMVNEWIQEVFV